VIRSVRHQNIIFFWCFLCRCGEFSVPVAPSRDTSYVIVKQFEETGNVCDKRRKGGKCSASVRAEAIVDDKKNTMHPNYSKNFAFHIFFNSSIINIFPFACIEENLDAGSTILLGISNHMNSL
jgi:hypothetical protein